MCFRLFTCRQMKVVSQDIFDLDPSPTQYVEKSIFITMFLITDVVSHKYFFYCLKIKVVGNNSPDSCIFLYFKNLKDLFAR